jgi:hypothetical protein
VHRRAWTSGGTSSLFSSDRQLPAPPDRRFCSCGIDCSGLADWCRSATSVPLAPPSLSESCLAGRIVPGSRWGRPADDVPGRRADSRRGTEAAGRTVWPGAVYLRQAAAAVEAGRPQLDQRGRAGVLGYRAGGRRERDGGREAAMERCGHGAVGRPWRGCTSNTTIPECDTKTAPQPRLNRQCQRPWPSSSSAHSGCLEQGAVEAERE